MNIPRVNVSLLFYIFCFAAFVIGCKSNVVRMKDESLTIAILDINKDDSITVEFKNNTGKIVRLWDYPNSWGWNNWRILVIRDSVTFFIQRNPNEGFTMNVPTYISLPSREKRAEVLTINNGDWRCGNDKEFHFLKYDEIIVVYNVMETPESRKLDVWVGTIVAFFKYK